MLWKSSKNQFDRPKKKRWTKPRIFFLICPFKKIRPCRFVVKVFRSLVNYVTDKKRGKVREDKIGTISKKKDVRIDPVIHFTLILSDIDSERVDKQ